MHRPHASMIGRRRSRNPCPGRSLQGRAAGAQEAPRRSRGGYGLLAGPRPERRPHPAEHLNEQAQIRYGTSRKDWVMGRLVSGRRGLLPHPVATGRVSRPARLCVGRHELGSHEGPTLCDGPQCHRPSQHQREGTGVDPTTCAGSGVAAAVRQRYERCGCPSRLGQAVLQRRGGSIGLPLGRPVG